MENKSQTSSLQDNMKDNDGHVSPSSSPPTPPSPLPISVGPGNQKYYFSPSPSPSPPFSPPSSHTSAEDVPLLHDRLDIVVNPAQVPASFSLDWPNPGDEFDSRSSCILDLIDWFIQRCCGCCSKSPNRSTDNTTRTQKKI